MANIQDSEIIHNSNSAFFEEHYGNFDEALSLHEAAISGLNSIIKNASGEETRSIAQNQANFHNSRLPLLRSILEQKNGSLPVILPTFQSAEDSILSGCSGRTAIGLEEPLLCQYLLERFENPDLSPPSQIKQLMQPSIPPYAPTLDPSLPSKKYQIIVEADSLNSSYWLKAHPVGHPDQICYTLRASRWAKEQLDNVSFYRSTEFAKPCISVNIASVQATGNKAFASLKGRPIEYITANSIRPVVEMPDILEERPWGPQKFLYGGRNFAWVTPETLNGLQLPVLYETESVWSETKKNERKEHAVVGKRLCWGDFKSGIETAATVEIAGGVDQLFEELLLASQMTKLAIFLFGHDS
ncbi:hypothetical protein H072_1614 [Dactylellina haptotyla CBS 200.50]|uniref:Uncharacterized protein n=1 Tax=Dactylellina haptotyla (strain CBS 200.50) TaxID=1284197 RepID=S8ANA5_DACHA|nr:hypothetical protein H072_1614 [Dactylellina haptotyla CBS 200.50]